MLFQIFFLKRFRWASEASTKQTRLKKQTRFLFIYFHLPYFAAHCPPQAFQKTFSFSVRFHFPIIRPLALRRSMCLINAFSFSFSIIGRNHDHLLVTRKTHNKYKNRIVDTLLNILVAQQKASSFTLFLPRPISFFESF